MTFDFALMMMFDLKSSRIKLTAVLGQRDAEPAQCGLLCAGIKHSVSFGFRRKGANLGRILLNTKILSKHCRKITTLFRQCFHNIVDILLKHCCYFNHIVLSLLCPCHIIVKICVDIASFLQPLLKHYEHCESLCNIWVLLWYGIVTYCWIVVRFVALSLWNVVIVVIVIVKCCHCCHCHCETLFLSLSL